MSTAYLIVVHCLALVGLLSILASVGVWIFTARLEEPRPDVAAVVAAHTGNVRVLPNPNEAVWAEREAMFFGKSS